MQMAMIGLGRMGGNMVQRLLKGGHEIVVWNRSKAPVAEAVQAGAIAAETIPELVSRLQHPRAAWVMLPAGDVTENMILQLMDLLSPGDTIIDGGNSNYRETIRRSKMVTAKGLNYVDVGTSGGIWGITEGYSLMIGGTEEAVRPLYPIFETLAPGPDKGWGHVGPSGAGHFVKMVHNGIEYGMMQAFAEGFEIMKTKTDLELDVAQIAEIWRYGSVVRSWLLDLTAAALKENVNLEGIKGWVADSGEGRWTVAEAIDLDIPAPVITMSLLMRFVSRQEDTYAAKLLAAMRNQFGGHEIKRGD
ncbi:decarboxylating 6-phosphogluconate dehydrogenase [Anaerolineae bacterium CFX9]|nr:decarboxylating 6-phosphogluconate dehydrogenase [Kamptonema cortianum]MDL1901770.1 decarboxylating 6-phosphogluconate dehydrogenase [Anaerolineae bacterium CFX9]